MTEYSKHIVLEDDYGIRPAGKPDECFYCHQKVGNYHKSDCAVIHKKVSIRLTLELEAYAYAPDTEMLKYLIENKDYFLPDMIKSNQEKDLYINCYDVEVLEIDEENTERAKD